jgi:uncharacterized protein
LDELKHELLGPAFPITHAIQTNATLIDQDWCDFFKRHAHCLSLGVSCDGPAFLHDRYRKNWRGQSTHAHVMRGIDLLAENKIPFGIIAVITPKALDHADDVFDFFYQYRATIKTLHLNLVKDFYDEKSEFFRSDPVEQKFRRFWGRILHRIQTAPEHLEIYNLRTLFSHIYHLQETAGDSLIDHSPLGSINIDNEGNVTTFFPSLGLAKGHPADMYGEGGFVIGNLNQTTLEEMVRTGKFQRMRNDYDVSREACRSECGYFPVCGGGFPMIKYLEHGTVNATETRNCRITVKAFVDTALEDIRRHHLFPQRSA